MKTASIPLCAVLLALLLCSCSKSNNHSQGKQASELPFSMDKTVTKYDRFENRTSVTSAGSKITEHLFLWFYYDCDGQTTECDPALVTADFRISVDPKHRVSYVNWHELIFLADGQRIQGESGGGVWFSLGEGSENGIVNFTSDAFSKLIRAHSVEGRLGSTEFTIQESDLDKWRTFADGFGSSKKP
jgi:hypothetical protein